jgi:chromosome segregation ATPase
MSKAVDRAGRPMYDNKGNKLTMRERNYAYRIVELEAELKTAEAAHHYVVIERDKLRVENTELEERIETNYQEYQDMDAYYEKAIKEFESQLQIIRTLAQAAVDAKYVDEGELDALAKALGD